MIKNCYNEASTFQKYSALKLVSNLRTCCQASQSIPLTSCIIASFWPSLTNGKSWSAPTNRRRPPQYWPSTRSNGIPKIRVTSFRVRRSFCRGFEHMWRSCWAQIDRYTSSWTERRQPKPNAQRAKQRLVNGKMTPGDKNIQDNLRRIHKPAKKGKLNLIPNKNTASSGCALTTAI